MSDAVLVTGASSGIGRRVAECLAARGCLVYAGARHERDVQTLSEIDNVEALRLDVTSAADIAAATEHITRSGRGLYGLVNSAGVATCGTVVDGDDGEFDLVLEVNVRGLYRITKALAPAIIASHGRITTMGSISGFLAPGRLSAYSMSKHAVEAFTDSLAEEMEPLGVCVSVVEAGRYASRLVDNMATRLGGVAGLPTLTTAKDPAEVADAVMLALFEPQPKRRYLVVSGESEARLTISKQLERLVQLSSGYSYTYSREVLIQMLDHELRKATRCPISDSS